MIMFDIEKTCFFGANQNIFCCILLAHRIAVYLVF